MIMLREWLMFITSLFIVYLLSFVALPRVAQLDCCSVIRHNMEKGIDPTAYFYTEVEDFDKYLQKKK